MKLDRGFIKWQPFESVVSSKKIITNLLYEKAKITKPNLSEEDKKMIEKRIIDAYYSSTKINIYYYNDGIIITINSKIKKIDQIYKMIYLENNLKLFFNQIVSIETK